MLPSVRLLINCRLIMFLAQIGVLTLSFFFPCTLRFPFHIISIRTFLFVTLFWLLYFRISANGESNSCDVLCDHSSIIGRQAGINTNGCISGLLADLACNLFACRWACHCWTSKNDFPRVIVTTKQWW